MRLLRGGSAERIVVWLMSTRMWNETTFLGMLIDTD